MKHKMQIEYVSCFMTAVILFCVEKMLKMFFESMESYSKSNDDFVLL